MQLKQQISNELPENRDSEMTNPVSGFYPDGGWFLWWNVPQFKQEARRLVSL